MVGDYFTMYMEAYAIPNMEAITVARKLVDEYFCRFSVPEQLHSDQGKQYESILLKEICDKLGILKTRTTPYHPQCDGLIERFNRTLIHMLSTTVKDHPFDWNDRLRKVCLAYNSTIQSTTGYTPYFLMFGREARLPVDIVFGTSERLVTMTPGEYADHVKSSLIKAHENVQKALAEGHRHQKQIYDQKVHGDPYQINDLVWLHYPAISKGVSKKLHHPWTDPFKVLERINDCNYRIRHVNRRKPPFVVHFNRLKLCSPETRLEQVRGYYTSPRNKELNQATTHTGANTGLPLGTNPLVYEDEDVMPNDAPNLGLPAQALNERRRYPRRDRHPPDRFAPMIIHFADYET